MQYDVNTIGDGIIVYNYDLLSYKNHCLKCAGKVTRMLIYCYHQPCIRQPVY